MSTTTRPDARPTFNDPGLHQEIMRLRAVDHATNLGFLAIEYGCLAAIIGGAIAFREWRRGSGLSWWWDVPVLGLAIVLVGALQHRLAGLGHEAAHYSLLKNKVLNDLIGDVFCMFPILSTIHFYRLFHLAHHQYTNDPTRDPDLVTLGGSRMVERFPMSRWEFIKRSISGCSPNPLPSSDTSETTSTSTCWAGRRTSTSAARPSCTERAAPGLGWGRCSGFVYLLAFIAGQWAITLAGRPDWLVYEGILGTFLVVATARVLPRTAFFRSPFRQPIPTGPQACCGWCIIRGFWSRWGYCGCDGWAIVVLLLGSLGPSLDDVVPVLHAPSRRLPAHQRRRRAD